MSRVDNEILHRQMNWRYACKKFDPTKKIREEDWNILAETLRLTPSSFGLQPWKFIIVQDPELRKKLLPLAWGQTPVTEASHFVVITYKEKMDAAHIEKFVEQTAKTRPDTEITKLDKFRSSAISSLVTGPRSATIGDWAQRQTFIAMGSFLTTAALMEIDTLPMEGLDPAGFDKVLNLENSGFKTIAAIACGYRSPEDKNQHAKKIRFDISEVVIYK